MYIFIRFLTFMLILLQVSCSNNDIKIPYKNNVIKKDINYNISGKELYISRKIRDKICHHNNISNCPKIFITNGGFKTINGSIFLGKDEISNLPNNNALVFIIAHEIAHIKLNDSGEKLVEFKKTLRSPEVFISSGFISAYILAAIIYNDKKIEYRADIEGIKLMRNSGYDINDPVQYINYLAKGEIREMLLKLHGKTKRKAKYGIYLDTIQQSPHPLWAKRIINIKVFLRDEKNY